MPLINVKVIEGVFSAEQKARIIRNLTDAMVEIEGGKPLATADVRALSAARPAKTA